MCAKDSNYKWIYGSCLYNPSASRAYMTTQKESANVLHSSGRSDKILRLTTAQLSRIITAQNHKWVTSRCKFGVLYSSLYRSHQMKTPETKTCLKILPVERKAAGYDIRGPTVVLKVLPLPFSCIITCTASSPLYPGLIIEAPVLDCNLAELRCKLHSTLSISWTRIPCITWPSPTFPAESLFLHSRWRRSNTGHPDYACYFPVSHPPPWLQLRASPIIFSESAIWNTTSTTSSTNPPNTTPKALSVPLPRNPAPAPIQRQISR